MSTPRFLVLRVPNVGPRALAGEPNDFATLEEAEARRAQILSAQLQPHHTTIEIVSYSGSRADYLHANEILY